MQRTRAHARMPSLLAALAVSACAPSARLERGDRVRIEPTRLGMSQVEGTFLAVESDSLRLAPVGAGTPPAGTPSIAVASRDIRSLSVGRGRPRRTWWGAAIGAFVAGAAGASLGRRECGDDHPLDWVCGVEGALLLGIPGGVLGGVVGTFIRGEERWELVPLEGVFESRRSP